MNDLTVMAFSGTATVAIRRTITVVVFVIALLSFAFGFGNGWQLGLSLGVAGWIAPLVAPAVDLSVIALLATVQYLRAQGVGGRLIGPRLLLVFCGLITFALNTAHPILAGQAGRACFDAVAPSLLIGWSEVGPRLLGLLHGAVPDEQIAVGDGTEDRQPTLPLPLIKQAHQLNADNRQRTGRSITRDSLRAKLRVSNAVAGELLQRVRTPSDIPGRDLSTASHLE
jgi:hypothetical protein